MYCAGLRGAGIPMCEALHLFTDGSHHRAGARNHLFDRYGWWRLERDSSMLFVSAGLIDDGFERGLRRPPREPVESAVTRYPAPPLLAVPLGIGFLIRHL